MTMREKLAWVCLITTVLVWTPYFVFMALLLGRGALNPGAVIAAFVLAVVLSTAFAIAGAIGVSLFGKQEPKDERDAAIDARALKVAHYLLAGLSFTAVGGVFVLAISRGATPSGDLLSATLMSQAWLLCFVASEVVYYGLQVLGYRRGA